VHVHIRKAGHQKPMPTVNAACIRGHASRAYWPDPLNPALCDEHHLVLHNPCPIHRNDSDINECGYFLSLNPRGEKQNEHYPFHDWSSLPVAGPAHCWANKYRWPSVPEPAF